MSTWEEIFQQREWGQWPDLSLIRFYKGQLQGSWVSHLPPNVLEIGAGSGANLWFLAREGAVVSAVDLSGTAIALAKEKLDLESVGWSRGTLVEERLIECSAAEMPFIDSSFDAVVDIECIANMGWNEARRAIKECYRVARPGAWLFCRMLDGSNALDCEPVGNQGLVRIIRGLLDGMPPLRLLSSEDIPLLLDPWSITSVDNESRTLSDGALTLSEHVIVARKP
jgi:SAM-dependent methyltransferase